jgi:hypothetical protein
MALVALHPAQAEPGHARRVLGKRERLLLRRAAAGHPDVDLDQQLELDPGLGRRRRELVDVRGRQPRP